MESDYLKVSRINAYLYEALLNALPGGTPDLSPSLPLRQFCFLSGKQHTNPPGPPRDYIPS